MSFSSTRSGRSPHLPPCSSPPPSCLGLTPDFRWFELIDCRGLLSHIPMTVILIALCTAVTFGLTLLLVPERFISFPRYSFDRYLVVIALYPFLSVVGLDDFLDCRR